MVKKTSKWVLAALAASLVSGGFAATLKGGDSVAFLGDSITQQGWGSGGYVRMCEAAFAANKLNVKIIPAGISGHKSNQMLERLDRDVLSKKPTYMTLSCGVNDVWHGARGVPLPQYKENITAIIDKAQAAGVKVVVLTATMIKEDAENSLNKQLIPYNDFLRGLAKEKGCVLVDLNAEMQRQVKAFREATGSKANCRTRDGVHMDFVGNRMMALKILEDGFQFTEEEMAKTDAAIRGMTVQLNMPAAKIKVEDYLRLSEKAASEKKATMEYAGPRLAEAAQKAANAVIGTVE